MHDSLAVTVANEVLSDPDTTDVRLYCRSLSTMELTPTNQVHIHESAAFINQPKPVAPQGVVTPIGAVSRDVTTVKIFDRFKN